MHSLRQGVRLKKCQHVTHVSRTSLEVELSPFEILMQDIRFRRYTLHKVMVNGEPPLNVKTYAQSAILDFIRSRPPLRPVKDRKLKPLPPRIPGPLESLLHEIRSQPKLGSVTIRQ